MSRGKSSFIDAFLSVNEINNEELEHKNADNSSEDDCDISINDDDISITDKYLDYIWSMIYLNRDNLYVLKSDTDILITKRKHLIEYIYELINDLERLEHRQNKDTLVIRLQECKYQRLKSTNDLLSRVEYKCKKLLERINEVNNTLNLLFTAKEALINLQETRGEFMC